MTDVERTDDGGERRLDAELRRLSRTVEPGHDLWPGIEARLEPRGERRRFSWAMQAAAALLLVAGSSLLTATLLDRNPPAGKMATAPQATVAATQGGSTAAAVPAAFGPGTHLDAEYVAARQQLTAMLNERIGNMPASTRAKLELNLAEMRRAAEQINAALAEQPGDPLLEELLLKTYQDELAVLANVNQLTDALGGTAATNAESKRVEL